MQEEILRVQHTTTLGTAEWLGDLLTDQGRHKNAEQVLRGFPEQRGIVSGIRGLSTVQVLDKLAVALCNQGKYEEAKQLFQRAVEEELGKENPPASGSTEWGASAMSRHRSVIDNNYLPIVSSGSDSPPQTCSYSHF